MDEWRLHLSYTKKDLIDYLLDSADEINHSERSRRMPGLCDTLGKCTLRTKATRRSTGVVVQNDLVTKTYDFERANAVSGYQYTKSETHPQFSQNIRKGVLPDGDLGGPFFSRMVSVMPVGIPDRHFFKKEYFDNPYDISFEYDGYVFPTIPSSVPAPTDLTLRDLRPLGSTAISRCKPTNSVAELATFLAELYSDGLPKLFGSTLWRENVLKARSAGDEYLNVEFGWKPLVSDVQDIMFALSHADTVLQQYELNSGTTVRRRYEFAIEETSSPLVSMGNDYPVTAPTVNATPLLDTTKAKGQSYRVTKTWRRTWFSGAFTYHLPSDYRSRNRLISLGAQARTLLGLDLDPEVIWNAAPWSWAIDWFSNAGDVISNLTDWADDGLVLKYGYIMEHTINSSVYFWSGQTCLPGNPVPTAIESRVETKRREAATPFGFSVDWSGLSPRQWAIATALGLTRR
jgi:hypothetical protein